jgi:2'-5' RNA ligase
MRLFVAVDPPEAVRKQLREICRDVSGAKWTRPDQLHLTLRFIGEADAKDLARIRGALSRVSGDAFSLRFREVGRFPPRGSPRILWAGIEPEDPVRRLHWQVEEALREAGVEKDPRPFSPHLTLARLRDARFGDADVFLERGRTFRTDGFPVEEFSLYSSVLAPEGATHNRDQVFSLRKTPPASSPASG